MKYILLVLILLAPQAYADMNEEGTVAADKKNHCIKAIGSKEFCECFSQNSPSNVSFTQYVEFFSFGPEEWDYDKLSPNAKMLYGKIKQVHDQCVH